MATVFDLFKQVAYTYYPVKRGSVKGNVLDTKNKKELIGVFKNRAGFTRAGNIETTGTNKGDMATLHAHPEDFGAMEDIIGNAVVVGGVTYDVKGATAGMNFDTGVLEHYTLTLQRAEYAN